MPVFCLPTCTSAWPPGRLAALMGQSRPRPLVRMAHPREEENFECAYDTGLRQWRKVGMEVALVENRANPIPMRNSMTGQERRKKKVGRKDN